MEPGHVVISSRFNGPPASGQGGYVGGVVAKLMGGTAEVTLRRPPPLETPLEVERLDGGTVSLRRGEEVVAEGRAAALDLDIPEPPSYAEAEAAVASFAGFRDHPLPTCFGCGSERAEGDGLRIFSGRVAGRDMVAAPWTLYDSLANENGAIASEMLWAALDCPSGWVFADLLERDFADGARALLGRIVAEVDDGLVPHGRGIAIAWPLARNGRKLYSGAALFSETGELWGAARTTWIVVLPDN